MELLVMSDTHLTKYDVSYDPVSMDGFLKSLINDYGYFQNIQEKARNENEVLSRYDECRDLKVVKVCEDNSKIHKGRKRITRKTHSVKYLYSFTAITYPEIYYAIIKFLKGGAADFGIFDMFLNPNEYIRYNYNLESYVLLDSMNELRLLSDMENTYHYNNEMARKLSGQAKCLKEFYNLLTFNVIFERKINNYETLNMLKRVHNQIQLISSTYNMYLDPTTNLLDNCLGNTLTYKEIKLAKENCEAIEKIKSLSIEKTKHL